MADAAGAAPPAEGLRERNKREKRERIQRAARELFLARGYDATALRAVARRAGVGTGTLFLYARDKRELLFQVFAGEARQLFARGRAAGRRQRGLVGQLMALFGAFIDWYAAHPDLARAVVRDLFFREHDPGTLGALTLEFGAHVASLVDEARERGEVDPAVPTDAAAAGLFAHYAFWMQGWLGAGLVDRASAQTRLRRALELQVRGLAPRTPREECP